MSQAMTPMQSLQEKMQQHIRDKFAELVPEEVWKGLSDKVISDYMTVDLPKLINGELEILCRERIKATLKTPEFSDKWDSNNQLSSEGMKGLLIQVAPEMFARIFADMAQRIVQQSRY